MKRHTCLTIIALAFLAISSASAQDNGVLFKRAEELHRQYKFDQAIEIYRDYLRQHPDSLLQTEADSLRNMTVQSRLVTSENGRNMLMFTCAPQTVAKENFPARDFFLRYPMGTDAGWVIPPYSGNENIQGNPYNVMSYSPDSRTLVFSAPDESGSWNIVSTTKINDTLWTAPQILNENVTTMGNEILPLISPDGKTLCFSSDGHYGMGGFDLYMSHWNEETGDWDVAQNLGFPFSSTADDFLYYNTPDGQFTVFASNREKVPGAMTVYAVKYEAVPLKKQISQEEAAAMACLAPPKGKQETAEAAKREQPENDFSEYTSAVKQLRGLQTELRKALDVLDNSREVYGRTVEPEKKKALESLISEQETAAMGLQETVNGATSRLQEIELDFLSKGIMIPQEDETESQPVQAAEISRFTFARNRMGDTLAINMEDPEPKIDLSFRILDEAVLTDLAEIPDGLVYHIQLFTLSRKATIKSLRGLSPVFERKLASGRYTYSAGLFFTHAEALKNLNTVRKRGFSTALITAYNNGKSLPVKNARILEKKNKEEQIFRVTISGYETLPKEALDAIRENTDRDIARMNIGGVMKYVVGPLDGRNIADKLAQDLINRGIKAVEVEKIQKN